MGLENPNLQTRWHEDDLSSRLMKLAETDKSADHWTIVSFPALREEGENPDDPRAVGEPLWPEKFPIHELEMNRAALGSSTFNAMYQQNPVSLQGNIFRREWFRFFREPQEKYDEVIQSWDMAFRETKNSDFVVGQVWGRVGANKYLLDQVRGRMDFAATVRAVRAMSEKYPSAKVKLVEAKTKSLA